MFKENKYLHIYYSIIERAKTRVCEDYTETHHIIPRALGGNNEKTNLVELTPREHFICHLILPRITDGINRQKMIYAYTIMSGRKVYGSKKYEFYRKEYAKINSILRSGAGNGMWGVDRSGDKNTFFGKKHSAESKKKISEKKKGVSIKLPPKTLEHRKKISMARAQNSAKYKFIHSKYGEFCGTTGDLARRYNFSKTSEAYKLVKGYYKTYKGWKFVCLL